MPQAVKGESRAHRVPWFLIGRLRRSLPRKTDLNHFTATALERHVQRLNDTPRKCLDFKTPAEAFSKLKSIVALQT